MAASNHPSEPSWISDKWTGGGIAVGDFNDDGKPDLVIVDNGSNQLRILLGTGDGTFKTPLCKDLGFGVQSVAVADFNRDGKLDLALAGNTGLTNGSLSILIGRGDGSFEVVYHELVAGGPQALSVSDLNRDGNCDIILGTSSFGIEVFLGKGDGTLAKPVTYGLGGYHTTTAVMAADFNGDGNLDIAQTDADFSGTLRVLLGNGDGTFRAPIEYLVGTKAFAMAADDWSGDGRPDLIVGNAGQLVLLKTSAVVRPRLTIDRHNAAAKVSWPVLTEGFRLESTPSLTATNWSLAPELPIFQNGRAMISVLPDGRQRYFRLRREQ